MMELNRRRFLQAGGTAALMGTAGCDAPHKALWPYTGLPNEAKPPFAPPSGESIDLATHTLNRLTFGARPGQHERILRLAKREEDAVDKFIDEQLAPEKINDDRAEFRVQKFETLALAPIGEFYEFRPHILREELTRATLTRAVYSERQLYEVMVRFWSDHFNIDISKGECKWLKPADDRNVIRPHALGKFPELLAASARSQAMLTYLDGRENRVRKPEDHPNENYARELLELHTLGVHGGYTQQDVMEIARCLSGWRIGRGLFQVGKVQFEPGLHDNRTKIVLGEAIPVRTGRDGQKDFDDVLRIVAAHPSTGRHIAAKLCQRFIADEPPAAAIETVAREFTKTKGDIRETLRALFGTDEFRSTRGNKFKQPLHFLASALRGTDAETDAARPLVNYLARMGHMPFEYPAPDGYPAHAEPWMSTLLWRWNFAAKLAQGRINGTKIQRERLPKRAGDLAKLAAHLLGRQPSDDELAAAKASKNPIGLLLASPRFQWS
jgi:uncharacterized protein (DUF1800 family)